ncbi:hypothetical protein J4430_02500 [Candidatus Woesearchaeota archaeon]|nr:hypothetical protein [Candidatus Woesearchaeota archaeon]
MDVSKRLIFLISISFVLVAFYFAYATLVPSFATSFPSATLSGPRTNGTIMSHEISQRINISIQTTGPGNFTNVTIILPTEAILTSLSNVTSFGAGWIFVNNSNNTATAVTGETARDRLNWSAGTDLEIDEGVNGTTHYFAFNVTWKAGNESITAFAGNNFTIIIRNGTSDQVNTTLVVPFDGISPRVNFRKINVTDGNATLFSFNGAGLNELNGTDVISLGGDARYGPSLQPANYTIYAELTEPNVDTVLLLVNTSGAPLNTTSLNSTEFVLTSTPAVSRMRQVNSEGTIYVGSFNGGALTGTNVISFAIYVNDTTKHSNMSINSFNGNAAGFIFNVSTTLPKIEKITINNANLTSYNILEGINSVRGGDDWFQPGSHNVTVVVSGSNLTDNITLFYNSAGPVSVFLNASVVNATGRVMMNNITSHFEGTNATYAILPANTTYLDFNGLESLSTVSFALVLNTTEAYAYAPANFTYKIDKVAPVLTISTPADRDISPTTGSISYTCTATDDGSGVDSGTFEWTLTKPGGKGTVTKTGSSVTWTGTDVNEAGTYQVGCTVKDIAGLQGSKTTTSVNDFLVLVSSSSSSSGGGGGGGGSGGSATTPSFDVDFSKVDVTTGQSVSQATLQIAQGSSRTFSFDGQTTHKMTVTSVTSDEVVVRIESDPIEVSLMVGESKRVDINGDGVDDLEVTLDSIENGVANITTKKLEEGAKVVVEEERKAAEEAAMEEPSTGETPTTTPPSAGGSNTALIVTILVILALLVVAYFVFIKKK